MEIHLQPPYIGTLLHILVKCVGTVGVAALILNQLYFIGVLLQEKVKNRVFVNLDSRYADYFPEYLSYFGGALRLLKYMYGMTNSGKLFADELTEWLIEAGFIQSQCQMSIYYKYAPYRRKIDEL